MRGNKNIIHSILNVLSPKRESYTPSDVKKSDIKKLNEVKSNRHQARNRQKYGLKAFHYDDHVIYARNQENADRKAINKGYKILNNG